MMTFGESYTAANEGRRHNCYLDQGGIPTIGIGFTGTMMTDGRQIAMGLTLTDDEIDAEWVLRYPKAEKEASDDLGIDAWNDLDEVRRAVLTDIAYQTGGNGLAGYHKMLAAIKIKDWPTASKECLDILTFKQTPNRCRKNADMLLSGLSQNSNHMEQEMDQPVTQKPSSQTSVSQTAATAFGTVGGASVLLWSIACFKAHELIVPDQTTAMIMSGGIAPFFHAIGRSILRKLGESDTPLSSNS